MRTRPLVFALLALAATAVLGACGDDDSGEPPSPAAGASVSASASPGSGTPGASTTPLPASPTAPPAVTPTPTKPPAQALASNPRYVLYVVGVEDTVEKIADMFDGVAGPPPADLIAAIRRDNGLDPGTPLALNQELAIPQRLPGTLSLFADASLEAALGVGGKAGSLVLLQPSIALRDGFRGRLALHSVVLRNGDPALEGFGYLMEYWAADRTVNKGGEVDELAQVTTPAVIIGGGVLAGRVKDARPRDIYEFERDGVRYAIGTLAGGLPSAQELAGFFQTAAER